MFTPKCFSEVRSKAVSMVEDGECPSIAVAIAKGGQILWEEAIGWADQDDEVEATPDTIYPIASLSKSLTATGIMILVEQHKVGIDNPVEEYILPSKLTAYEGETSKVTVRRVLNMTSGIPHGYLVSEDPYSLQALQKFVNRYGIVVFPPGEMELYSNFAYAILELIIETVSGESYTNFMKTAVFQPLGMTQTSVGEPHASNSLKHLATKYTSEKHTIPHNYFVPAAAGGIYASLHDIISYGMFHLKNHLSEQEQILEDETLTAMHTTKEENLQSTIMALGWGSVTLHENNRWVLSNGGIEGATSMLSLVPSKDLAVACLTNISSPKRVTDKIAIEATNALLPKFSERVAASMKRYELENAFTPYCLNLHLIGVWEGAIQTLETETPIELAFQNNGEIYVRLGDQQKTLLKNVHVKDCELKGDFQGAQSTEGIYHGDEISIHVRVGEKRMYGVVTELEKSKGLLLPSYVYLRAYA